MKRFNILFILASWIIFFTTGKGIVGASFLIASGLYTLCEIVTRPSTKDE